MQHVSDDNERQLFIYRGSMRFPSREQEKKINKSARKKNYSLVSEMTDKMKKCDLASRFNSSACGKWPAVPRERETR
jgi:hypothetical protein